MPLVSREQPVRIDLPTAGEWVEVKPRLSKGDEERVKMRLLSSTRIQIDKLDDLQGISPSDMLGGDGVSAADLIDALTWMTLEIAIVGWSFYEGRPKPEDIRDIDPESYDVIVARLNELYPASRSDDDRKNSSGNGAMPSEALAPSLVTSAG